LHALLSELLKERLRNVTPVTKEFAKQRAYQLRQEITAIHIARRYFYSQQFLSTIGKLYIPQPIQPL
jgi:hypothetical protein